MTWFILAILTAFFESLKDVFGKVSLKEIDVFVASWSWRFFALPVLLPALLLVPFPGFTPKFWGALLVSGLMNILVSILYMKAIKETDLSLAVPLITFTPLFLLLTSPIILGEFPTWIGLGGILLIVSGAYLLNIEDRKKGFWAPLKALVYDKGARIMLLVAFLWSITANVDKIGVQHSSPFYWATMVNAFMIIGLLPIMMVRSTKVVQKLKVNWKPLVLMGVSSGLVLLFQMSAIKITLVPYVISIKRTSAAMSVLWGFYIFGEQQIGSRLLGVMIMLAGVLLIAFG